VIRVFYLRPKVFILIFQLKDLGVASYILGIDIHRDRKNEVLGLLQNTYIYINNIFKKFSMHVCNCTLVVVVKEDKLESDQGPRNQYEIDRMNRFHTHKHSKTLWMLKYVLSLCWHSKLGCLIDFRRI
jgi:hypothetical protein